MLTSYNALRIADLKHYATCTDIKNVMLKMKVTSIGVKPAEDCTHQIAPYVPIPLPIAMYDRTSVHIV